ncbi:MAG: HPr-rel-A system PqqD family peptide chaperone [Gemmatimonadales bacterium]|nr:HPr-rel-A system PqqD family peptide chaperone [Gemmatimonadales bacterium]
MDKKIMRESVVVVTPKQVWSDFLEDEIVVLDVQEGAYYVLNEVGARIWAMIQEPRTVDEIIRALLEEYDVEETQGVHEVVRLLQDLANRGLVDVRDGPG